MISTQEAIATAARRASTLAAQRNVELDPVKEVTDVRVPAKISSSTTNTNPQGDPNNGTDAILFGMSVGQLVPIVALGGLVWWAMR